MTKVIDTDFFLKLLTLEDTLAKGKKDSEAMLNLILHYKQLKDPIKTYFMEKIQSVVTCPNVQGIIQQKKMEAESPSFSHQVLKFQRLAIVQSVANMNRDLPTVQTLQDQYEQQRFNIDLLVKSDLQKQEENIKQKIKHRKTSSCMGTPSVRQKKIYDLNITPLESPRNNSNDCLILQLGSQVFEDTSQQTQE